MHLLGCLRCDAGQDCDMHASRPIWRAAARAATASRLWHDGTRASADPNGGSSAYSLKFRQYRIGTGVNKKCKELFGHGPPLTESRRPIAGGGPPLTGSQRPLLAVVACIPEHPLQPAALLEERLHALTLQGGRRRGQRDIKSCHVHARARIRHPALQAITCAQKQRSSCNKHGKPQPARIAARTCASPSSPATSFTMPTTSRASPSYSVPPNRSKKRWYSGWQEPAGGMAGRGVADGCVGAFRREKPRRVRAPGRPAGARMHAYMHAAAPAAASSRLPAGPPPLAPGGRAAHPAAAAPWPPPGRQQSRAGWRPGLQEHKRTHKLGERRGAGGVCA